MEYTEDEYVPAVLRIHGDSIGDVNFQTNVVGTTFREDAERVLRFLKDKVSVDDIRVRMVHERDNKYDPCAVAVGVSVRGAKKFVKIGYVPRDRNTLLCYALDRPQTYQVEVGRVSMFGGDDMKPNIGMFFNYRILKIF